MQSIGTSRSKGPWKRGDEEDDGWVMGPICTDILQKLKRTAEARLEVEAMRRARADLEAQMQGLGRSASEALSTALVAPPTSALGPGREAATSSSGPRRMRMKCASPGCACLCYDAVITLPSAGFDKMTLATQVKPAARHFLDQADMDAEVFTDATMKKEDFVEQFEACLPAGWESIDDEDSGRPYYLHRASGKRQWEHPVAAPDEACVRAGSELHSTEAQTLCGDFSAGAAGASYLLSFVVQPYKHLAATQVRDGSRKLALARLHRAYVEVNCALLPNVLRWCEEYVFTKRKMEQEIGRGTLVTATDYRPRLRCRCGHADIWHNLDSHEAKAKVPPRQTSNAAMTMRKSSSTSALHRSSASAAGTSPDATRQQPWPEATIRAGRLVVGGPLVWPGDRRGLGV